MNEQKVVYIPESKTMMVNGVIINEKDLSKEELERLKKEATVMKPLFGDDDRQSNNMILG